MPSQTPTGGAPVPPPPLAGGGEVYGVQKLELPGPTVYQQCVLAEITVPLGELLLHYRWRTVDRADRTARKRI